MIDDQQYYNKKKNNFFVRVLKSVLTVLFFLAVFLVAYFYFFGNSGKTGASKLIEEMSDEDIPLEQREAALENIQTLYYYNQLGSEEKIRYLQVFEAVTTRAETEISATGEDEIEEVFRYVVNDHPELFYVQGYQYSIYTDALNRTKKISVEGLFLYDEEETAKLQKKIDQAVETILAGATGLTDDFSKAKYIFDYVVENTQYVAGAKDNQNICSVLLSHESVCQGYAMSVQYLLNKMEVPTTLVIGEADGGNHAWNLVYADGDYYYMDATWGDMDYRNSEGELILDSKVRHIDYNYFLVTSKQLFATHETEDVELLPECVATKDNYYIHENLFLQEESEERIQEILEQNGDEIGEIIQFQCETKEIYDFTCQYLLKDEGIFEIFPDLENISYYNDDKSWTFYFWRG